MKPARIVGIVLIIVGVILLIYAGVTYTGHTKSIKIGPVQASAQTHKTPLAPPILGGALVVAGIIGIAVGARRT